MPPSPSLSALDPNTQAFPVLTPTQIDRIRPLGHIRGVQSGETLYKPNDSAVPLFVVLSGQMEVLRPTLDGERLVVIHNPGCFTGEMTMIAGQRCWVHGRVTATGEFLELSTSLPGVFAVGDARSGNVKRVASAVGEGAISVHMVHQALVGL